MELLTPLKLITQLCNALNIEGISYCHWKSNAAIARSASGENDLDLLVKRSNIQQFQEILFRLGFKECLTKGSKQLPGVQDFYGYDPQADKIIHVHAHYQLILGHDLTKNYHIPIENLYIESSQQKGIFRVPAPEFELIIFVIRMVIKHSTWDTILLRNGTLSKTEKEELVHLESKANLARVTVFLKQNLPFIDEELFNECRQALQPSYPLMRRITTGWRLQNQLKYHARLPQFVDACLKIWRRFAWPIRWRVFRCLPQKRFASGGLMVAIIGGDGAGKTTAINNLFEWLSPKFDVKKTHIGKPSWSKTTVLVRGILKVGTVLHLYPYEKAPVQYGEDHEIFEFPGFPFLIRQVCTARDRLLTYRKARRFASNGGIVICDRYHLRQIRFMESPNASIRMTNQVRNHWLVNFLIRIETKYYQQILLPELLIVLRLDPEIAVQRKQDEEEFQVRARSTEVWEFDWKDHPEYVIDASQTKEAVLSEIKDLVWSKF